MKIKRTWFYSSVLSVLLLVACTGASSDGQLVGEKITDLANLFVSREDTDSTKTSSR